MRIVPAAVNSPPSTPGGQTPHGPLLQFLGHPNAFFTSAWNDIAEFLIRSWPIAAPSAVAMLSTPIGLRLVLRSRHRRIMASHARLITVEVPAEVGADAAAKFWSHLHAMLRPNWRRLLDGQPHLSFEYASAPPEHGSRSGCQASSHREWSSPRSSQPGREPEPPSQATRRHRSR